MSGSFAIYKDRVTQVHGKATFVMEVVEVVPQPLYVAFDLDEMSIPVWLEAMTGVQYRLKEADAAAHLVAAAAHELESVGDGVGMASHAVRGAAESASAGIEAVEAAISHVESVLGVVELQQVRFHWADSVVNLPEGGQILPGVGLRGDISVFGWDAYAAVDFSARGVPGITGHFETEKIDIGGVLKISGDGAGVRSRQTTATDLHGITKANGAALQQNTSSPLAPASNSGEWRVQPGGPVLHITTQSSPFLHANLHAELFGFLQTDITADITDDGFEFDFSIAAGNAVTADLGCHWSAKRATLDAHGDIGIHLHGDIGPLLPGVAATSFHIDADLDGHILLSVSPEQFTLTVNGSFVYGGATLTLPPLDIHVTLTSLAQLAKAIWDHVVDEATAIFRDYLLPVGQFVEAAAAEVAEVAVDSARAVAAVAVEAGADVEAVAKGVASAVSAGAAEVDVVVKDLTAKAKEIDEQAVRLAAEAAAALLAAASSVAAAALRFADEAAARVEEIGRAVARLGEDAARYCAQAIEAATQWVAKQLDEAQRWVDAQFAEAEAFADLLERDVASEIADIEDQLEAAARAVSDVAEDAWRLAERGWCAIF